MNYKNAKSILRSEILSNLVALDNHLIGVEVECFVYNKDGVRMPSDKAGVYNGVDLIKELQDPFGPVKTPDIYSLEPGGQLEWASHPHRRLTDIELQFKGHLSRFKSILQDRKMFVTDSSLEPIWQPEEIELIGQYKYELMDNLFQTTGTLGRWMMRNSASIQINIDFRDSNEAEEMAFVADCIQPIASFLFSNTPFMNKVKTGIKNSRYNVWLNTDNKRCGSLLSHGIDTNEGLIEKYCDYVSSVPMIFAQNLSGEFYKFDGTVGNWIENGNSDLTDGKVARIALHQIFTHIRFKQVLEVRGCDRPPLGFELAPPAFWTGLLIDEEIRKEALKIVKTWSRTERELLEQNVKELDGAQAGPAGKTINEWVFELTGLATEGLVNRGKRVNVNEAFLLEMFMEKFKENGPAGLYFQDKFETAEDFIRSRQFETKVDSYGW